MNNLNRRAFIRSISANTLAGIALATAINMPALAVDPIIDGIPAAQSGPVGVADHQDWTNGAIMAIEEINAKGGVLDRPLEAKIIPLCLNSCNWSLSLFPELTTLLYYGACNSCGKSVIV